MSKEALQLPAPEMDIHDIQYAERTLRHIRRVQNHMLYLIAHCSDELELSNDEKWQLFQNAIKHDMSKWSVEQFQPYVDKFNRKLNNEDAFEAAWRNHYMAENHHYKSGRWIDKLQVIEIVCDLQSMADEFNEGSCFHFWDTKWRPDFHKWLNSDQGRETDVYRQMADDYKWHVDLVGRMQQVIKCLNREEI
jgi:hypothetical protein